MLLSDSIFFISFADNSSYLGLAISDSDEGNIAKSYSFLSSLSFLFLSISSNFAFLILNFFLEASTQSSQLFWWNRCFLQEVYFIFSSGLFGSSISSLLWIISELLRIFSDSSFIYDSSPFLELSSISSLFSSSSIPSSSSYFITCSDWLLLWSSISWSLTLAWFFCSHDLYICK